SMAYHCIGNFWSMFFAFFFFQAEDGIRDSSVTGVQTCALPICEHSLLRSDRAIPRSRFFGGSDADAARRRHAAHRARCALRGTRSEERRVGKESRYRGSEAKLKRE